MRSLFFGLATLASAENLGLSDDTLQSIDAQLSKECGAECVTMWHGMLTQTKDMSLEHGLKHLMDGVSTESQHFQNALQNSETLNSFLSEKAGAENAARMETPCYDAKSCAVAETVANKCNYSRIATLATYQAVNMAVHVFGVVFKTLCACVDVYTASACMLGTVFPPCIALDSQYRAMFQSTTSIWESVKSMTNQCKVVGEARVASMLR